MLIWRNQSATRIVASTLGILVGIFGFEHGVFEVLQGNVRPSGFLIDAIGPAQEFWPGAMEPAVTIIPNFFIIGILAMIFGILVFIWSAWFIDRKYGARILMVLCIILLLVGGGSPPLSNGSLACLTATRINKPLTWWRTHLSNNTRGTLAKLWPWSMITFVLVGLLGVEIAIFGYPLAGVLSFESIMTILYIIGNSSLAVMMIAILSALAYDIQRTLGEETNPL